MTADPRGRRVAVVADARLAGLLPELRSAGFGAIQLPPTGLEPDVRAAWLEQVAEHVAEFRRHDYEVVLADDGTSERELTGCLAELGVGPLPAYTPSPQ